MTPKAATRHAPNRSAAAPKKGDESPQIRFCTAMASEKIWTPPSSAVEIGTRNRPKTCLTPKVTETKAAADNVIMTQRNCVVVDNIDGISHSAKKGLIRISAIKPVSQAGSRYASNNSDCSLKNLYAIISFLKLIINSDQWFLFLYQRVKSTITQNLGINENILV